MLPEFEDIRQIDNIAGDLSGNASRARWLAKENDERELVIEALEWAAANAERVARLVRACLAKMKGGA